jgi:hypothetical protein
MQFTAVTSGAILLSADFVVVSLSLADFVAVPVSADFVAVPPSVCFAAVSIVLAPTFFGAETDLQSLEVFFAADIASILILRQFSNNEKVGRTH